MSELAVIGSETFGIGFRLAGIQKVWIADSVEDLERTVRKAQSDAAVSILVMETADVQRLDGRTRHQLVSSVKPTLVAVGVDEDNTLRDKIKQAVGVDLW